MKDWRYSRIDVSLIEEAKANANNMSKEVFDRLVENIRRGGLSSAPALWRRNEDGKYVIISGHHRIKACKKLSMTEIGCLWVEEDQMSDDEKIATQLSHNSLHGEDNKGILKRMFSEITSVDFKQFAHIDIDEIDGAKTFSSTIIPVSEHYNVSFVLYKKDYEALKELFGIVREDMSNSELVVLADQESTEDLLFETIKSIRERFKIKSANVSFCKILELAQAKMREECGMGQEPIISQNSQHKKL